MDVYNPPPKLVHHRIDTRTYRVDYYVEEVPWEVQNAEQGTSDGDCGRRVVERVFQARWGQWCNDYYKASRWEHSMGGGTPDTLWEKVVFPPKEYPEPFLERWGVRCTDRRWDSIRNRRNKRTRTHSLQRRCVSRGKVHVLTSKEALYA